MLILSSLKLIVTGRKGSVRIIKKMKKIHLITLLLPTLGGKIQRAYYFVL